MTAGAGNASAGGAPVKLWDDSGHQHDMFSTRLLGFWLYMLSDSLVFAALFAAYGVLSYPMSAAGGPTKMQVVEPVYAYVESVVFFASVLAYGLAMVDLKHDRPRALTLWMIAAFVLGAGFVGMEANELLGLAARGAGPQRSGFLSAFFTILVVHGVHAVFGLLWMLVMMVQVAAKGLTPKVTYRLVNLKVFWLYQGVIWCLVYSFVYLWGAI
ncbi:cytochrome c oxidase subunit 3 [Lichenicoccus sp.]|uniref:cytochrome c oxidase subunit 3 n=1 Tax=Lichenicoccus sp. TaxID=2781899 RepID=UPI003D0B3FD8